MLAAAILRLLSHELSWWNVTPVTALALFGGSMVSDRRVALLLPISVLLITDAFIGFYKGMWVVYLAFAAVVFAGRWMISGLQPWRIVLASVTASTLFYLITNFAFLYPPTQYPHNAAGIVQSYVAALPFYRNALMGDLFYCGLLFGGLALWRRWLPAAHQSR